MADSATEGGFVVMADCIIIMLVPSVDWGVAISFLYIEV